MIKKGDRVKFLNDTGGGIVTSTSNPKLAMVLIDDGFEVPVPVSELIQVTGQQDYPAGDSHNADDHEETASAGPEDIEEDDEITGSATDISGTTLKQRGQYDEDLPVDYNRSGYSGEYRQKAAGSDHHGMQESKKYRSAESSSGTNGKSEPARSGAERNILAGLRENSSSKDLELWLINDSRFSVFYSLLKKEDSSWANIKTGHIEPDTKIMACSFRREEVNSFMTLKLQALFYMYGIYQPVSPSQCETELDPVDIYSAGSFTVNDFFEDDARIIPLISDPHDRELRKIQEEEVSRLASGRKEGDRLAKGPAKTKKVSADPLVEEVDLHIEDLVEDPAALSGREALDIQIARFTTALEGALRGKTKRIVFIHGIGQGKLKFEIRKTLDRKYPKLRYQDASFREYGYGATMVIIRK